MSYPTLDTLIGASNVAALTDLDAETQETLRQMAIAAAETFCGQTFGLDEDLAIYVDGTGTRELPLPRRLSVVDSLDAAGSSLTASDVSLSPDHDTLFVTPTASNWYEQAIRDNVPPLFASGMGTVLVTGDWGWSDAELDPEDPNTRLAMALRTDMEEQALAMTSGVSETSRAYVKLRVANLSEGPLNYAVDQTAVGLSPTVMMLLDPYVWTPLGVKV